MQDTLAPLLGETAALIVTFSITLIVVLGLIALVVWLVRTFSGRFGLTLNRSRVPRLGIVDALPIDGKRRLVLVRRDQFEHLLLIGGPADVVVEQTIFRGVPLTARLRPDVPKADARPAEAPRQPEHHGNGIPAREPVPPQPEAADPHRDDMVQPAPTSRR